MVRLAKRWLLALLVPAFIFGMAPAAASATEVEDKCGSAPNPIVCENALPGDPASDWQLEKVGDPTIQGYATSMSVNVGETEYFKINTPASSYHIQILRLGYYGGDGAHVVNTEVKPTAQLPQIQPECLKEQGTGLIDCGNWGVSAQWTVPSTAVSGVYVALLTRGDTGGQSQIIFVVRNDASHSKILLQTSDATWEAYNDYGGNSLYSCTVNCPPGNPKSYKGAAAVSYNRPFDGALLTDNGASYLYYAEYQMMRFLEKNGYDISYTTSGEVDRNGALLQNHKIFMSSGHDEYWSAGQRSSVEAAREAGVNLAFFSANEVFWKTRWGPSIDGSETPYRTLTSYKETHFEGPVDPKDPSTWTGAWRDPRGGPQDDGGKPENALTGQQFEVNSGTGEITVPSQYSKLRVWRNTAVAALQPGQTLTLAPDVGTLGYEWDEDVDNGFRPAGEFDLSSTTMSGVQAFLDYGSTLTNSATATHHLTLYRAPSGALVFGAGTVQWSWGLDNTNAWAVGSTDPEHPPVDRNMQQFTVNLLAEMGAQPESIASGLVAGAQSTDTAPPTSTITSPTAGETLPDGSQVTIAGVASDAGGGVVGGVEVSTDNGASWHPATLTTPAEQTVAWSYTWATHGYPATTIKSRAVDDSSNLETPSAGVHVNVSCPCSIWGQATTPSTPDSGDAHAVEVGVKFSTETFGLITGLRFYKSAANTGTHIGNLWSASGQKLETATFTGETASGWQQVTFNKPVDIFPGTTYVASYFAPVGHYAASADYFYTPTAVGGNVLNSPPLHALPAGGPAVGGVFASANGLYSYGSTSTFPTSSFAGTNYWVDPVFTPVTAPAQVTNVSAVAGSRTATVSWSAPSGGGPVTTYTITPYIGSEAQTATTISGTPPATSATVTGLTGGATYTFTVQASNPNGSGAVSSQSNAVTPAMLSVPSTPTGVAASAASSQAQITWSAPSNNGGSSITSYTVTPYLGASAQTAIEVAASATSTVVKNLVNGSSYTFTVAANNAIGAGPASSASSAVMPQDTVFDFSTPALTDAGDASATEVGVKFTSTLAGTVTGIRFYKAAANTGTHVGSLWSSSGTKLAEATFSSETASGWQQVNFASPVTIAANTTYVAAYLAPKGHYSATSSAFATSGFSNPPLAALANSVSVNGVYLYTSKTAFPSNTFKSTNYWVDLDFEPTPVPAQPTNVQAIAGPGLATVTWSAPSGGGPVTTYTITPYIGSQAQPATTVSGSPPPTGATVNGLTDGINYTFTVQASNSNGAGPVSAPSNVVNPSALAAPGAPTGVTVSAATSQAQVSWSEPASNGGSPITSYTVTPYLGANPQQTVEFPTSATTALVKGLTNGSSYTFTVTANNAVGAGPASAASSAVSPQDTIFDFSTPATIDSGDPTATVLGVKFAAETYGAVTGIRFYKAAANTGTHIVSLWSSSGTLLASTPVTGETASGWQQANFTQPIYVTAGSTYIASYLAPAGHYSDTTSAFALAGTSNGPLSALSNTLSANGVFARSTTNTFPTSGGGGTNYWVDLDFEPAAIPGQVTNVNATAGRGSANLTWSAPSGGGPVTAYTITPYIGAEAQSATTIIGTPPATGTTIAGLTNGSSYTFTVRASNPNGEGAVSASSGAITPANTPTAPTSVAATAANASATVTWAEPSNGGSPITSYTITPFIGNEAKSPTTITGTPPATGTTITGLTNGSSYTFTVTANNAVGAGPASERSSAVTPLTTPSAPAPVTATAGNASAKVSWTAPSNGGSPITSYTITPFIGAEAQSATTITGTPPATATTITGLTNGTSYTFTVAATSAVGAGPASSPSNAVTPNMAPGAPTGVSATAGNTTASVTWTAPENGGSPVTSYTITPFVGATPQTPTTISGSPPATSATITGLTNGTSYTFTVSATNAAGSGPASERSNAVTPVSITAPSAPSAVTASAATHQALLSWTAPTSNGGSPITSYILTPYIGSSAQTPTEVSAPATSAIVKSLTNASPYTFTVTAVNAVGASVPSSASSAVTPRDTIFDFATPATINSNDAHSTELGVKFTSAVAGHITGIRFYKAAANTGTHVATLWSVIGTRIGEATFTGESASGWQQANFNTPIAINANTTYVAAYLAPKGDYSASSSQFTAESFSNPPLAALGNPLSANGVYAYSNTSVFPTSTFKATNYWVDVDFEPES